MRKPELLAPAGDFDKLIIAFLYGADAVYIGAKSFGLRSSAGNFTIEEIEKAIEYAKKQNKKVYLVVNTLAHNDEIDDIADFLKSIKNLKLDALIISDAGVLTQAKICTNFDIHLSTQASALNYESAIFWRDCGIKRVILGREASLTEAYKIADKSNVEIEIFIHGSMCLSYSGKCTISNYLSLRDANRGGCTNSCRWKYSFKGNSEDIHLFNSRDLWAIEEIPEIVKTNKIASLKIEGRMKNHLYLANTISTYRKAIDLCYEGYVNNGNVGLEYEKILPSLKQELMSNENRTFTKAFLLQRAGKESILHTGKENSSLYINIGNVLNCLSEVEFVIDVKNDCSVKDIIEVMLTEYPIKRRIKNIKDMSGAELETINNNRLAYITFDEPIINNVDYLTVIRKAI